MDIQQNSIEVLEERRLRLFGDLKGMGNEDFKSDSGMECQEHEEKGKA